MFEVAHLDSAELRDDARIARGDDPERIFERQNKEEGDDREDRRDEPELEPVSGLALARHVRIQDRDDENDGDSPLGKSVSRTRATLPSETDGAMYPA